MRAHRAHYAFMVAVTIGGGACSAGSGTAALTRFCDLSSDAREAGMQVDSWVRGSDEPDPAVVRLTLTEAVDTAKLVAAKAPGDIAPAAKVLAAGRAEMDVVVASHDYDLGVARQDLRFGELVADGDVADAAARLDSYVGMNCTVTAGPSSTVAAPDTAPVETVATTPPVSVAPVAPTDSAVPGAPAATTVPVVPVDSSSPPAPGDPATSPTVPPTLAPVRPTTPVNDPATVATIVKALLQYTSVIDDQWICVREGLLGAVGEERLIAILRSASSTPEEDQLIAGVLDACGLDSTQILGPVGT